MSFSKDFDTLLNSILTDYQNQFPGIDLSQGSLVFIKSACTASALWGLYKHQDWVANQIFPDTCDTNNLNHHAWLRDIARTAGELDDAMLARVLEYIRRPPAGGNKYDYVKWAMSIDNVAAAWCFPIARGLGTVDVVILANSTNTGSELPSAYASNVTGSNTSISEGKLVNSGATLQSAGVTKGDLVKNTITNYQALVVSVDGQTQITLSADIFTETAQAYTITSLCKTVKDFIDDVRPVCGTSTAVSVVGPTIQTQAVTMTVAGDADKDQIVADITAYMQTLIPTQVLYRARLLQIALNNGADNATVSTPSADVTPTTYHMIRPGAISVA